MFSVSGASVVRQGVGAVGVCSEVLQGGPSPNRLPSTIWTGVGPAPDLFGRVRSGPGCGNPVGRSLMELIFAMIMSNPDRGFGLCLALQRSPEKIEP